MTQKDAVLAANLEFYRAFTNQDMEAMESVWAKRAMVLCTHPGWTPLAGRVAVMASWHDILGHPEAPAVMCRDDQAFLYGDVAVVLCQEELPGGRLAATNIFLKEDGHWRMVHHQASPILAGESEPPPRRLN
jgi:ketosteroid isomerase-like protein